MNKKIKDRSGSVYLNREKLYSQHEVDNMLEKKKGEEVLSPQEREDKEVEEETQTVDRQKRADKRTVAGLVKSSNRLVASITAVFPFDFFPDSITVEEGKVAIIERHFLSSTVHSVDIKDISNVFLNRNIFFSQLEIVSRTFEDNEVVIGLLRHKEAIFIRRIIEGLRVLINKQIDTSVYTTEELVAKLEELSTAKIIT
jgi:hypothetical protein